MCSQSRAFAGRWRNGEGTVRCSARARGGRFRIERGHQCWLAEIRERSNTKNRQWILLWMPQGAKD